MANVRDLMLWFKIHPTLAPHSLRTLRPLAINLTLPMFNAYNLFKTQRCLTYYKFPYEMLISVPCLKLSMHLWACF